MDGVVFYLPPSDDVAGWDYPRHNALVNAQKIPSLLIREDVDTVSAELRQRLHDYLKMLGRVA